MSDKFTGQIAHSEKLTPELFDSHVGEKFRVTHQPFETEETHTHPIHVADPAGQDSDQVPQFVELELVEVTRYPTIKELEGGFENRLREPFSLLFVGPHELLLMSCLHTVHHQQLGTGQFFFNPVQVSLKHPADRHPEGMFYEVAFN